MSCKEYKEKFKNLYCFEPYDFQIEVIEKILDNKFPLLIKAPTGSGKTEAVLAPFLFQFKDNNFFIAPRLIYVLPMRVLVNSIAERIEKYAKKVSPHISVKIQHGDLPGSPFFIGDIIVTTLDQFVYGFARASKEVGRHIDMPAGAIASSMVVLDEAHMYRDGFTFSIMRAVMEILYHTKIPFVLMTATMPESLEKSLFENIENYEKIIGKDVVKSQIEIKISEEPLYRDEKVNISEDLLEKIKFKKTLIVLNQVKRAQRVYEELKERLKLSDDEIVLLHSRFTKLDRFNHENKAISMLTHKQDGELIIPKEAGIVVSTQVLEAGIDFSAELLLTELAPADALVQRAGRCARYDRETGEMIIFPVDGDKAHLPYEKEHLQKTLDWLTENSDLNIKDFNQVCKFVNESLDYIANDYEASDTLIDLYECVLYADTKPENIQIRDGKSIRLVVVDFSIGEGRGKGERIKDAISKTNLRDNSIDIDFGVGWMLFKNDKLKYKINYNFEKKEWEVSEINGVSPFGIYILEKNDYDTKIGVKNDQFFFI
jgi:CRISPR-associated endonuclease/helicase Cas3